MEHLTRLLSWSFVFGAIATLLYTNFKPALSELLTAEVPVESVQGAAADREPVKASTPNPAGSPASATGRDAARDACAEAGQSRGADGCDRPSS